MKIGNAMFYFFLPLILEIDWCVFYTYNTSRFGLPTLQMFSSHIWVVATVLEDSIILMVLQKIVIVRYFRLVQLRLIYANVPFKY